MRVVSLDTIEDESEGEERGKGGDGKERGKERDRLNICTTPAGELE